MLCVGRGRPRIHARFPSALSSPLPQRGLPSAPPPAAHCCFGHLVLKAFDMNERWSWRMEGLSWQGATGGGPLPFSCFSHYPPCKSWVVVVGKDLVNEHKLLLCLELPIIVVCHSCPPPLSLPELKNLAILPAFMATAFSSRSLPFFPFFLGGASLSLSLYFKINSPGCLATSTL